MKTKKKKNPIFSIIPCRLAALFQTPIRSSRGGNAEVTRPRKKLLLRLLHDRGMCVAALFSLPANRRIDCHFLPIGNDARLLSTAGGRRMMSLDRIYRSGPSGENCRPQRPTGLAEASAGSCRSRSRLLPPQYFLKCMGRRNIPPTSHATVFSARCGRECEDFLHVFDPRCKRV